MIFVSLSSLSQSSQRKSKPAVTELRQQMLRARSGSARHGGLHRRLTEKDMGIYFSWRTTYKEEEGKGEQRKLSISDYGGYDMGNTILGLGGQLQWYSSYHTSLRA